MRSRRRVLARTGQGREYGQTMNPAQTPFWSVPVSELFRDLTTGADGLTGAEAVRRLEHYGLNVLKATSRSDNLHLLLGQVKSPIVLILIFAAVLSYFLHDHPDALIILIIILVSALLGFWQERGAANAVTKLLAMVRNTATVRRDGAAVEVPFEEIVPGDVVELSAGSSIPGDGVVIESRDLFLDEAALTGETYPVEKTPGEVPVNAPLAQRSNTLYMGTHVVSGTAQVLIVQTGLRTEFGRIAARLSLRPPETDFERGVRRFGYLLMEVTLILVVAIFAINVYLRRPVLDAFMFALALAVGLTPQLLPAIISVNLAHGAKRMAANNVIVKRLASIENLGTMNVLCSDKTGTLTEGIVRLYRALDIEGTESEKVLLQAYLNAAFESGFKNPIDEAIRSFRQFDLSGYQKLDESPYDFLRKRLSILISCKGKAVIITKGALANVLDVCRWVERPDGTRVAAADLREQIDRRFEDLSAQGFRVLGLASRELEGVTRIGREHEVDMTFLGFLVFHDPPKPGVIETIKELSRLGVALRIITGDNRLVAQSVGRSVGLPDPKILTGSDLRQMRDEALLTRASEVDIFAEVEPNQKEQILIALKKKGYVVGYMGDGINDASALHTADVGISVEGAVDVAKEAADIVLLEKGLDAVATGIRDGRRTFANTLKYVFMATSANFGNMFSMAGASLFLPFLPLLPKQILLTNLLTDLPEMTIATDSVDPEAVDKPRRWNVRFIRSFMVTFGILSSVFDFVTFGVLLLYLKAGVHHFRTGWFLESVVSACMVVLVVRSRRPFYRSRPSRYLLVATLAVIGITTALPFSPLGTVFGLPALPVGYLASLGAVIVSYVVAAELAKRVFYALVKS